MIDHLRNAFPLVLFHRTPPPLPHLPPNFLIEESLVLGRTWHGQHHFETYSPSWNKCPLTQPDLNPKQHSIIRKKIVILHWNSEKYLVPYEGDTTRILPWQPPSNAKNSPLPHSPLSTPDYKWRKGLSLPGPPSTGLSQINLCYYWAAFPFHFLHLVLFLQLDVGTNHQRK